MLSFSSGEEATDEKNHSFGVKATIFGLCGRGGFVPQPKPAQNVNAAQLGHSVFFSHVADVYWVLGTKPCTLQRGCEPVV